MATIIILATSVSGTGKIVEDLARVRGHTARRVPADRAAHGLDGAVVRGAQAVVVIPARGSYEQLGPLLEWLSRDTCGRHLLFVSSFAVGHGIRHPLAQATGALPHLLGAEHLLRAGRAPYTIVRPTWLTDDPAGAHAVTFTQDPEADGMLGRADLARVLLAAVEEPQARNRTFALFNEPGCPPREWSARFAALRTDDELRAA